MSDWKKRAIERRDFRHIKVDQEAKHRKKKKKKVWRLIVFYKTTFKLNSSRYFKFSMKYAKEADLREALKDMKRKRDEKNLGLLYDKYSIYHGKELIEKGKFENRQKTKKKQCKPS